MSNLKEDWKLWRDYEIQIMDCPESEMDELGNAIKEAWGDQEQRSYWEKRIHEEAEKIRALKASRVLTNKIKEELNASKTDAA